MSKTSADHSCQDDFLFSGGGKFNSQWRGQSGEYQSRQPANSKNPPTGAQHRATTILFQTYIIDLRIWCSCTEAPINRQAGLIVLALGGAARLVCKDLPMNILTNGAPMDLGDGLGAVARTGVAIVIHTLRREFEPEQQERYLKNIAKILHYRRLSGESVDSVLARFETDF